MNSIDSRDRVISGRKNLLQVPGAENENEPKRVTTSFRSFQKIKALKPFKSLFTTPTPEDGSEHPSSSNVNNRSNNGNSKSVSRKRNIPLSFIRKSKEENRREKNLKLIGEIGEFDPRHVALQLSVLLFESDDHTQSPEGSISIETVNNESTDYCISNNVECRKLDWKHTIDMHARWCITFTLLGDEKAAGGLPNVETGVARMLFLSKVAEECRKLGNVMAFRGITKGLCHSHLAWLWDFVHHKHIKKINDLRKLSKKDVEATNTICLQDVNVIKLRQRIKEVQAQSSSRPFIRISNNNNNINEQENYSSQAAGTDGVTQMAVELRKQLSRANSEPESTSECAVPELESGSERSTVLLRVSKSEPLGFNESKIMGSLAKIYVDKGPEINEILRLQISRARSSSELKSLSEAIQNKLSSQMAKVLKESGLM
uniref:Ras-GEF domain-containing protein n=1 Tax=Aplanochytrium stocchinoi TaxID=215587 RepID=A0A7S3LNV8_9STRA|mmetsp:Transcript_7383/g.9364  ORF Transcript_7383/g.9364 Transcript_7383/m.9364 type:complete len:430 (+) Transcript_7383:195-1484(+)|eukprot:CAMPEP_0204825024 /NCGR_PEP_ID=MMETSP1346-20131115/2992_1 /ASSEMBLY_ACC=CAM_ASM_000771 /TAXON_ID=215587 /ORGANISM="Aplanochytrium stocchinoi, Strain GSBS06" /LENGTH=429 /DNA_ID=CAMNT_0051952507 /DNA_START=526 /DNA_END=1815 /DNA_ORIENTATION=+